MNHLDTLTHQRVARAACVLSYPGLIRLVSEIDDHGPVPRRMLGHTFSDLSRHQIRHALQTAREQQLVSAGQHADHPCYLLTDTGVELADVYDTAARWARTHNFPAATGDFVTRIQRTLALLGERPVFEALSTSETPAREIAVRQLADAGLLPSADAALDLHRPWSVLSQWLRAHPYLGATAARGPSGFATAEEESAA